MNEEHNASNTSPDENPDDAAVYNIGAVVQLTDVPAATLRAWERRYEFPVPVRSHGGHRLYSDSEIMRIKWVKARVDEGMQPSQAVRALRLREKEEGIPLVERNGVGSYAGVIGPASLDSMRQQLVAALIDHDTARADSVLREAVAAADPETLMLGLVSPALDEFGVLWAEGQINIATEHLATNWLRQKLLMWMLTSPPPRSGKPVVLACAPGELHEGALLILATVLRRRRHPVAYLGQSMPLEDLAAIVDDLGASLVVVTATREDSAAALAEWPEWFKTDGQPSEPTVAYGGRIFVERPEWRQKVPGVFLGSSLEEGIDAIERLIRSG
jgi:DNA-binding transcriptional MerR regulator